MKPLNFNLTCPRCGSEFIAMFTKLQDDDTITCSCGYDFDLNESQRDELERVRKERNQEVANIHAGINREKN